jgi:biopolymer transport protein ExbD
MRFRRRSHEHPELNLVPMIDVLLMTLIFLVLTTSFSKETQLRIKLPESSSETQVQEAPLRVTIDAQGQYYVNSVQLLNNTPDVLRRAMQQAAGTQRDPLVVIYADGKTPHAAVIRAMDSARRLGFTHLTFATQQPAASSSP